MVIFDFFKRKKTVRTINGIQIEKLPTDLYDNIFPWASNIAKDTTLTIGDIVLLWWLNNSRTNKKAVPNYFEKNYFESFEKELKKLMDGGWISKDKKLTEKGNAALSKNLDIVEKHKKGWMSEKDIDSFKKAKTEDEIRHNIWLRKNGLSDIAERNENWQENEKIQDKMYQEFKLAEKLAKNGEIESSNKILFELLEKKFANTVLVYDRLAKNLRKQKRYEEEVKLCKDFLSKERLKYGNQWNGYFKKRIAFSEQKIKGGSK